MSSTSFSRLATVSASTKRPPATSSGKVGSPATNITSLVCTPLDPVDMELRDRFGLDTSITVKQSFCDGGLDIVLGDILVVNSIEYPIKALGEWEWRGSTYHHMILEVLPR